MIVKRLKRWLFLSHRWLGIVTCLLFATWFVSGLVMMYVGFPTLEEAERRPALPSLDWQQVRLSPAEALAAAGEARFPQDLRLAMLDRLPVYRITGWDGSRRTLSAVDGRAIPIVEAGTALGIAGHDPRAVRPVDLGTVGRDQWSVTARYDPLRPFHLVALGDPAGTRLYVSARTGEVALDTTGRERFWNWVGAIPHWIYLTPLRAQAELWRDVVLWVSGISIVTAVSGFWVGLLRVRVRRRYRDGRPTPYRGWMAWHHLAGSVGGVTLLTFIVSGWLSVNPNRWFASQSLSQATLERYAGVTEPRFDLGVSELRGGLCPDVVEVRFRHLGGAPLAQAACRDGRTVTCCEAGGSSQPRLDDAIGRLMPEAGPARIRRLDREDAYWYGHHQTVVLPILRAVFSDPSGTWFHIDPTTGEVLNRTDRSARLYRWLFNGLHSWDYGFLIRRRPAWDLAVWALAALGLVTSVSGIAIGWRRLRKQDARLASIVQLRSKSKSQSA